MTSALVVDDSRIMRMVIRSHLLSCGIGEGDIFEAENGQEALLKIEERRPDLVLSDVNMPVMDGEQLLYYLADSQFFASGRAVMVTSRYERKLFRRLLDAGATSIIRKPFTATSFHRQLEPVLQDIADNRGRVVSHRPSHVERPTHAAPVPSTGEAASTLRSNAALGVIAAKSVAVVLGTMGLQSRVVPTGELEGCDLLFADVDIEGPPASNLVIYADSVVCDAISQEMVGVPALDEEARADVMGEVANIVVGRYLADATPASHNRRFSTPNTGLATPAEVFLTDMAAVYVDGAGKIYIGILD